MEYDEAAGDRARDLSALAVVHFLVHSAAIANAVVQAVKDQQRVAIDPDRSVDLYAVNGAET